MKTIARRYSEVRRLPISEPVARARQGAGGNYFNSGEFLKFGCDLWGVDAKGRDSKVFEGDKFQ